MKYFHRQQTHFIFHRILPFICMALFLSLFCLSAVEAQTIEEKNPTDYPWTGKQNVLFYYDKNFNEKKTPDPKSNLVGEIVVKNKKVIEIKGKGNAGQTTIPNNGFVLAAHGTAWKWFIDHNVQVGTQIAINDNRVSIQNTPGGSSSRTDLTDIQSQIQSLEADTRDLFDRTNQVSMLSDKIDELEKSINDLKTSIKSLKPGGRPSSNWILWLGILSVALLALAIWFWHQLKQDKKNFASLNEKIDSITQEQKPFEQDEQKFKTAVRDEVQRLADKARQEMGEEESGIFIPETDVKKITQGISGFFEKFQKLGGQSIGDGEISRVVTTELKNFNFMESPLITREFEQRDTEIKTKLSKKVFDEHKTEITTTLSSKINKDDITNLRNGLKKDIDEHKKEIQEQIRKYKEELAECVDELFRGDEEAEEDDDEEEEPYISEEPPEDEEEKTSTGENEDEEEEGKGVTDERKEKQLEAIEALRSNFGPLVIEHDSWKLINSKLEEIENHVCSGDHGVIQSTLLPDTIEFLYWFLEAETVKQLVDNLDFSTLWGIKLDHQKPRRSRSGSSKVMTFEELKEHIKSKVSDCKLSNKFFETMKGKVQKAQQGGEAQGDIVIWVVRPSISTTDGKLINAEEPQTVITGESAQRKVLERS